MVSQCSAILPVCARNKSQNATGRPPKCPSLITSTKVRSPRTDFVFHSRDGTPLDTDNFRHREFPKPLRRAGLRHIQFHDLRHTYASLLIAQGAHPKHIQTQLGHASIQTTLDRYGHLMPEIHQAEARKLDQFLFGDADASLPRDLTVVGVGSPAGGSKMGAERERG
jgi:hypothetical protein